MPQVWIDSLMQVKEGLLNNARQNEEKITVHYEITRVLYMNLYKELKTLSTDEYLNGNLLSKLPKVHNLPKTVESVNTTLTQGLKEIKGLISKLQLMKEYIVIENPKRIRNDDEMQNCQDSHWEY